jgi:glycosyltransferase involved in cell wall biosynthesis
MKNLIKSISIIVPVFNEEGNIVEIFNKIKNICKQINIEYEIIFINDGSQDSSEEILNKIYSENSNIKLINFIKNYGQTAAFLAGFEYAKNELIITIDSDLQNDPNDIPKIIDKINQGYDLVSGNRVNRKDSISRVFLSNIANKIISKIFDLKINDIGCSLKGYRSEFGKKIKIYGEMHRLLPVFAFMEGAKIAEIPVNHFERKFGKSKYGMNRIIKILLDILVLKFFENYLKKPIYLFGGFGVILLILSFFSIAGALYLKFVYNISLILTPLPLLSAMTFILGVICFLLGLIAEMQMRILFNDTKYNSSYKIKDNK